MSDFKKKFYSRCDFGVTNVGEVPVVAGAVEGRVAMKGVTHGEDKDGRKYAKFSISLTNQKKNVLYWAGMLGATEKDILSKTSENGSEYTNLNIYISGREAERAAKYLVAGDIVDVAGFLKLSKSDTGRFLTFYAYGYKLVRKNDKTAEPSSVNQEGAYVPEMIDDDSEVPF